MLNRGILAGFLGLAMLAGSAVAQESETPKPKKKNVEVVFVLDTTGSMGGLIAGAKKKIWSIANTIASGKPTPNIKIGLVAYRDKTDAYNTQITPMTDDLDAVYAKLQGFKAQGGGDHPENVRQALQDAVEKIEWSKDKSTLKIMFLVGDAPPHLDYKDVKTVDELCEAAVRSDIIVNTIRCGSHVETGKIWQLIARKSEGKYFSISQSGGVTAIATPFDSKIGEISDKMGKTLIAYGDKRNRAKAKKVADEAEKMEEDAKADRGAAYGRMGKLSTGDLIDAIKAGSVKLAEIKKEHLPKEMQEMTLEQKKAHVEKKSKERESLRKEILELTQKREKYIQAELKKKGTKDAFDQVVKDALREQAGKKGITIESDK